MVSDDSQSVRQCLDGVPGAFEILLQRYRKPVFNAALRMVHSVDDASDVTQTVFLKAFENLRQYDPRYKFYSWIYRIAINESLNFLQRRKRMEPMDGADLPGAESTDDPLERDETQRAVRQGIMALQPDHRAVIVLRHFLELSYREMAEILTIEEKTVKSRLFTARLKLRDLLLRGEAL